MTKSFRISKGKINGVRLTTFFFFDIINRVRLILEVECMIQKYLIKVGIFLLNCIYSIFKLLPTNSNKVLFLSRQSNKPSIDFRMIVSQLEEDRDVKIIMMTKRIEKRIKDVLFKNVPLFLRQMYHLATSKVCIVDGYNITVSVLKHKKSLIIFQIWHSLGAVKKFGYLALKTPYQQMIAKELKMHKNYSYIIAPSMEIKKYFKQCFGYKEDHFLLGTLPRIEYLKTHHRVNKEKIYRKYPQFRNKKIVLYAPTFRTQGTDRTQEIIDAFQNSKYLFILKVHPNTKTKYRISNCVYDCREFSTLQLLSVADYVITDYSGISLEAASLKKPVYIYGYDFEDYQKDPGMNYDLKKEFGKYFFKDAHALYECIAHEKYDKQVVIDYFNKYVVQTQDVTQKLVDLIIEKGLEDEETDYRLFEKTS